MIEGADTPAPSVKTPFRHLPTGTMPGPKERPEEAAAHEP